MQKVPDHSDEGDRRLIRRWGLASVGFYGSLLAGMILYAALHSNSDFKYASADLAPLVSAMKVAHH